MVQIFEGFHVFNHDFNTATLAYLNRYPNPYAKHVLSCDTLESYVDSDGNLRTTKLVIKQGRLPGFIKPFLGSSLQSWILEKSVINPKTKLMMTYTSNIDHRKFIRVEEYLTYDGSDGVTTSVHGRVRFTSNLVGFKNKIEDWSHNRFSANFKNSREGLKYVMNQLKEAKYLTTSNL